MGAVAGDEAAHDISGGETYAAAGPGVVRGDDAISDVAGAVFDTAAGLGMVSGDDAIVDFAGAAVDAAAGDGVIIGDGAVGNIARAAGDSAAVLGLVAGQSAIGEYAITTIVANSAAVIVGFVVFQEAVVQVCGALVIVNCPAVVSLITGAEAVVQSCGAPVIVNCPAVTIGDVIGEPAISKNRSAVGGFGPGAAVFEGMVVVKSAGEKIWLAVIVAADGPAEIATLIILKNAIFDFRTGAIDKNCSADETIDPLDGFGGSVAVDNGYAEQDGISIFVIFKVKGSVREALGAADINDGCRYGVGVVGVAALDGDHFAVVAHVAVAGAGISAHFDDDDVAVGCGIDGVLNLGEVGIVGNVVIDDEGGGFDGSSRMKQKQRNQKEQK